MMYLTGTGLKQDSAEAAKWLHKAADARSEGHNETSHNLGALYRNDKIDKQDFKNASKWFRKSGIGERGFKTTLKWLSNVVERK
jgi:TPR repeat protein